jgi:hypothetical protein
MQVFDYACILLVYVLIDTIMPNVCIHLLCCFIIMCYLTRECQCFLTFILPFYVLFDNVCINVFWLVYVLSDTQMPNVGIHIFFLLMC